MAKYPDLLKQSSIYFLGDMARRLASLIMMPLYTRCMSPAEYGAAELIDLTVMVASVVFGTLVMSDSMIRTYHVQSESRGRVISTGIYTVAVLSGALAILGIGFAHPMSLFLFRSTAYEGAVQAAFIALVFMNLAELGLVFQRMQHRAGRFVAISLTQLLLNIGLNIWLLVFLRMGVFGFVLGRLIAVGFSAIIVLVLTLREVGFKFDRMAARGMLSFGSPLLLSSWSIFIIHFSDRFFLTRYTTLAQVGIYALAYKIGFMVSYMVGEPFGRVWSVSLYKYASAPRWQEQFASVFRYLAFALVLVGLSLSIFSRQGLAILSNGAYAAGVRLIPVLVFAYVCREAGDFFRGVLFIGQRPGTFSAITVVCAMLNITLNYWLIPRHGAMGAAVATLLTWFAYMGICWIAAQFSQPIPYPLKALAVLSAACGLILYAGTLIEMQSLVIEGALKCLLLAAFTAVLLAAGYFPKSDLVELRRLALRRRELITLNVGLE
jgi:O-antigen/teichoic acid export membrane protein